MNAKEKFFREEGKRLLKDLLADKGLNHRELAAKLHEQGTWIETQPLINKLNRGRYSFSFALQVLAALGESSLRVPQLPKELRKRDPVPERDEH